MKNVRAIIGAVFVLSAMVGFSVHAADVSWDGSASHDWDTAANWSSSPSLPATGTGTSGDRVRIDGGTNQYAVYTSAEGSRYYRTVEVGYSGDGQLIVAGGTLIGDDGGSHYIARAGNTAIVNVSGGKYQLGAGLTCVGFDSGSAGIINLFGGELVFGRESSGTSGRIGGNGGSGSLNVSGGKFRTRAGIVLGYSGGTGVFSVQGSGATQIGIGSEGTIDGSWIQNSGSTLQALVDGRGLTEILVDDYGNDGTGGDVSFNNGALLDVGFVGVSRLGSWDVMTWEGSLLASNLLFAAGVDTNAWSFAFVDTDSSGAADTLLITYNPPDSIRPANLVAVASSGRIDLNWTSVSGATNYTVKRSLVFGGPYGTIDTTATNHYTDSGVTNGTTYYYVVSSLTGEGESSDSDQVSATPARFVHPGGLFKQSDLERMRYQIEAHIDPWYSSFLELQAYSRSSYNYTVQGNSYTTVERGGVNGNAYLSDTDAAYCNALMWMITQDTRHADKCVEIFNAWKTLINVQGGGTESLNAGLLAWKMVEAAEIIKSTYTGWNSSDLQAFKEMLVYPGYSDTAVPASVNTTNGTFYWRIYKGDPGRHGNQDAIAWRAMITMGIFLDNEKMYDRALRYFKSEPGRTDDIPMPTGPSPSGSVSSDNEYFTQYNYSGSTGAIADYGYNGALTNYFWENGQCQESSRDQDHTFFGLSICAGIADVAWNQGDAVWNGFDRRLLKGFEFSAKYNTSYVASFPDQSTPWEPTGTNFIQRLDRTGRWYSKKINPHYESNFTSISRGNFLDNKRPIYEQAVAHFAVRMGMSSNDYLWTLRSRDVAIAHDGYETTPALAWIADQPGWGAITFRRPPLAAGDPISGFAADGTPEFAIHKLSGMIEAENYDCFTDDGEGHTYHDLTSTNSGGAYRADAVDIATNATGETYLTDLEDGEWLSYTVCVPADGNYGIKVRYASGTPGGTLRISFGGTDVTSDVSLPSTGALTNWSTHVVAKNVALTQGVQVMQVRIGGVSNAFNLDHMAVLPVLEYVLNGASFDFSWPSNHPGWLLETQSSLLETNWISISGSDMTNSLSYLIGADLDSACFRLRGP